jgi:Ca2+-transporting ATPase
MEQPPRKKAEPIVNRTMRLGIVVQTLVQTAVVLAAFLLGLYWHLGEAIPEGTNILLYLLQYDWAVVDVLTAQTMAFATLSMAQLFRAYTVRSEKASLFSIGFFSNRYMQLAVGTSLLLLLLVINVPFLQPIFNTHSLSLSEWITVIALALIPAIAEELTKAYLRWREARSRQEGNEKRYAQAKKVPPGWLNFKLKVQPASSSKRLSDEMSGK